EASFGWVTLWQSENNGRHTLKLALLEPADQNRPSYLVLDAIRVSASQPAFPWLKTALLSLAAMVAAWVTIYNGALARKQKTA
ncbi:MAG: hypothetical protein ACYC6L_12940, partial [Anaerolineae bacterium]